MDVLFIINILSLYVIPDAMVHVLLVIHVWQSHVEIRQEYHYICLCYLIPVEQIRSVICALSSIHSLLYCIFVHPLLLLVLAPGY